MRSSTHVHTVSWIMESPRRLPVAVCTAGGHSSPTCNFSPAKRAANYARVEVASGPRRALAVAARTSHVVLRGSCEGSGCPNTYGGMGRKGPDPAMCNKRDGNEMRLPGISERVGSGDADVQR